MYLYLFWKLYIITNLACFYYLYYFTSFCFGRHTQISNLSTSCNIYFSEGSSYLDQHCPKKLAASEFLNSHSMTEHLMGSIYVYCILFSFSYKNIALVLMLEGNPRILGIYHYLENSITNLGFSHQKYQVLCCPFAPLLIISTVGCYSWFIFLFFQKYLSYANTILVPLEFALVKLLSF